MGDPPVPPVPEHEAGRVDASEDRAQLSLPVVEAAVGVLFVVAVLAGFGAAPPTAGVESQLDAHASDGLRALAADVPAGEGATRLAALTRSPDSFAAARTGTRDRLDALLPGTVRYRLVSPHGVVGAPGPPPGATGRASAHTPNGTVTLRVWYV